MEANATVFEAVPGTASAAVGDEVVLVDLSAEHYFGLNKVGAVIWAELSRGVTVDEVVGAVVARFDVSVERAAADVARLLTELDRAGLVRRRIPGRPG